MLSITPQRHVFAAATESNRDHSSSNRSNLALQPLILLRAIVGQGDTINLRSIPSPFQAFQAIWLCPPGLGFDQSK